MHSKERPPTRTAGGPKRAAPCASGGPPVCAAPRTSDRGAIYWRTASLRPCQPWRPPIACGYRPAPAPGLLQLLSEVEPLVRPLRASTVAFDQYGLRRQGSDDTFDQYGIQPFTAQMPLLTRMPLGLASRLPELFCPPRRISRLRVQFRASAPPIRVSRLRVAFRASGGATASRFRAPRRAKPWPGPGAREPADSDGRHAEEGRRHSKTLGGAVTAGA